MAEDKILILCHTADRPRYKPIIEKLGIQWKDWEDDYDGDAGRTCLYSIQQSINRHGRLLLILSEEFQKADGFLLFEIIMAIRKCHVTKKCCLVLALAPGMDEHLVPDIVELKKAKLVKLEENPSLLEHYLKGKNYSYF